MGTADCTKGSLASGFDSFESFLRDLPIYMKEVAGLVLEKILVRLVTAACAVVLEAPLCLYAVFLPKDDLVYIDRSIVEDINADGMPEVCLGAGSGWEYRVYYYLDGSVLQVEGLTPWTWSSGLCRTADGDLVMCAFPHTTGTEGILQYRIYEWGQTGYSLKEDLWRIPTEWDGEEQRITGFDYISSRTCIDPFGDAAYADSLITQAEFEQRIENLGEMTSVFDSDSAKEWRDWEEDEPANVDEIYESIREEILNWH